MPNHPTSPRILKLIARSSGGSVVFSAGTGPPCVPFRADRGKSGRHFHQLRECRSTQGQASGGGIEAAGLVRLVGPYDPSRENF